MWMALLWGSVKWLGLIMGFVMPVASQLTWAERRQSAMMQDRLGPNRANIGKVKLWGILHFVADAAKMMFKEDFVPARAHRALFTLAPLLAIIPVFIAFAIIPFGPTLYAHHAFDTLDACRWTAENPCVVAVNSVPVTGGEFLQVIHVEFGLLFYFAVASIANYGTTLAGWASYNKWALLGGLRASSQMMSYEVAMGLSILGVFLVTGTLEPGKIVDWQGPNPFHWGVCVQPIAFILFFTAAMAETKRAPFDIPEGEPEIVGYFVEYSGLRFGLFFLAEFIEVAFVGALITTVFFGGYHIPGLYQDGFYIGAWILKLPHLAVVVLQVVAWTLKVIFFCWLQLLIRWTLPRFRPDQLMDLGWKKLLPLSMLNVLGTAAWMTWCR
jgi:NADH-quinone oxidoreductase subunit H